MQPELEFQFEAIADELANRSFAIVENFLTPGDVTAILDTDEFRNRLLHFRKAGIGKGTDKQIVEQIRGDYIQWIDPSTAPQPVLTYLNKLSALTQFLNRSLFLGLKDSEIHMTTYPPGALYQRHLDQFKKDDHRKLSVICYLNTDWREEYGGQLRMHLVNGQHDIFPFAGKLVCFRSDAIEHEVLPSTRERFSLTGWLTDRSAGIY